MNKDALSLDEQLCFPIYALSRLITKRYREFLDPLDLTYTQYITMLVLWEKDRLSVSEIGQRLRLDSGTLTSVLRSMEAAGLLKRTRNSMDERSLVVTLTNKGTDLRRKALDVPANMAGCMALPMDELKALKVSSEKLLRIMDESQRIS